MSKPYEQKVTPDSTQPVDPAEKPAAIPEVPPTGKPLGLPDAKPSALGSQDKPPAKAAVSEPAAK